MENKLDIFKKIEKVLKEEKKIIFAYIFGSYVTTPAYAKDIDIGIFIKGKMSPRQEAKLALKIEEKIKKEVEIVVLNHQPLLFISEVLRKGKLIFSRNERQRIKFETSMLSQILEFNELIQEFDRIRFARYGIG